MHHDPEQCWLALEARDPRFDGLFFVGVSSTGIYCRPICPAKTPGRARCTFWRSAAEAERHGFRACLRCRPERAPGQAPSDARTRLLRRALGRLSPEPGATPSIERLATDLGVTSRHLRRVFTEDLGVTPHEVLTSRRVGLAAQLLAETSLPIDEVAACSGFGSARAFREAFRVRTGRTPSGARRGAAAEDPALRLRLDTRAPFLPEPLLAFLGGRAFAGAERVTDGTWARTVSLGERRGVLRVTPDDRGVVLTLDRALAPVTAQIVERVRRVFDLDARPDRVAAHLANDERLRDAVLARPGLRLPGAFDPFECAIRAVLGQQVSVAAATTLAGRLVRALGEPVESSPEGLDRLFPTAAVLAGSEEIVRGIGLPARRAATVSALARAVDEERVDLSDGCDPERAVHDLQQLPGVGPWTASYVAMRGLGWPDAFPAGDLALLKALGLRTAREAEARAERWRPWRAYAVLHLWQGA